MKKGSLLGFFFIVLVTVLIFVTLLIGDVNPFKKHVFYAVHFDSVEGLKEGDDVRVEGVAVGKVHKLRLLEDNGVLVELRVSDAVRLPEDSEILVESFSVLGGNYVSIRRGTSKRLQTPDAPFSGKTRPSALNELAAAVQENRETLRQVMTNVNETFKGTKTLVSEINEGRGTLGKLARDPALFDKAAETLDEARGAVAELRKTVDDVHARLTTPSGTVGKLLNSDELHAEAVRTVTELREEAKKAVAEVQKVAESARGLVGDLRSGEGLAGRIVSDRKMAEDFAATVEKLRVISTNLEQVTGKVARGEGTVGRLIQEDTIARKGEEAIDSLNKTLGRAANSRVFLMGESKSYAETEASISRVGVRIQFDDTKYISAGVAFLSFTADADTVVFEKQLEEGEDDTIFKGDIQLMYKIPWFLDNKLGVRAGLIEGKAGAALDYDFSLLNHEFFVTLEARDAYGHVDDEDIDENVRGPMSRIWLRTPLWNRDPKEWWQQVLYAIKVYAGASRLQDDPEFLVGIGLEYGDEDIRTLISLVGTAR